MYACGQPIYTVDVLMYKCQPSTKSFCFNSEHNKNFNGKIFIKYKMYYI